mmetsp:Transcript_38693/g.124967  ORF Transcript_38693/g.124967 Transcript_38693/m.124967 type:complete len:215 (-) Transcript_38693:587-1231(-)
MRQAPISSSSVERRKHTRRLEGREPRGRGARERVLIVRSGQDTWMGAPERGWHPSPHITKQEPVLRKTQIASLAAYRHPPPTPLPQKRTRRTPPQAAELRQLRPAVARHTSPASASRSSAAAPPRSSPSGGWAAGARRLAARPLCSAPPRASSRGGRASAEAAPRARGRRAAGRRTTGSRWCAGCGPPTVAPLAATRSPRSSASTAAAAPPSPA